MGFCSVKSCRSTSRTTKLYIIPRQLSQQQLWLEFLMPHCRPIKRPEEKRRISLKVCILHFEDKFFLPDGRRHKFAYPTLFTEEEIRTRKPQHTYSICTENVVAYVENFEKPLARASEEYKFGRSHDHTYCKSTIVKLVIDKTNPESATQPDKPCKNNGQTRTDPTPHVENEAPVSASQESQAPSQSVGEYFAKFHCDLTNKDISTHNPNTTLDSATYIPCEDMSVETEYLNEIFLDESLELTSNDEIDFLDENLDDKNLKPTYNDETLSDKNLELTKNEESIGRQNLDNTLDDENLELNINEKIRLLDKILDDENLKLTSNTETSDENLELTNNESFDVANDDFVVIIHSKNVPSQNSLEITQLRECESKPTIYTSDIPQQAECENKQTINTSSKLQQIECENKQVIYTSSIPQQRKFKNQQVIHTSATPQQTGCNDKQALNTLIIPKQSVYDNKQDMHTLILPQQAGCDNKQGIHTLNLPQQTGCDNKQPMHTLILPQQTGYDNKQAMHALNLPQQAGCDDKQAIHTLNLPQQTEYDDKQATHSLILPKQTGYDNKQPMYTLILPKQSGSDDKQAIHILNLPQQTRDDNKQAMYILNLPQQTGCDNKQAIHILNLPQQTGCDNKQAIHTFNLPQQTGCLNKQAMHILNLPQQTRDDNKQAMYILNLPQQTGCDNKQSMHTLNLPKQTGYDNKQAMHILNLPKQTGCSNNNQVFYNLVFSEPITSTISSHIYSDEKQNEIVKIEQFSYETQTEHVLSDTQKLVNARHIGTKILQQSQEEPANVHIDIPNIVQSSASSFKLYPQQELNETETNDGSLHEDSSLKAEENNENVDQVLIQTLKPILTEGLKKDVKEKLLQQYQIPENCSPLITPTLSPIVMAVASKKVKNREKYLQSKQDQLGVGIAAINKAYECILQNDIQETVQALYDSCLIFSDLHHTGTMERKQLIAPALKRKFASLFQNQETDETNVQDEFVKTAKSDLKANTKKRQKLDTTNQTQGNKIRSKKPIKRKGFHQDPN